MDAALLASYAARLKSRGFRSWRLYEQAARRFLRWLSSKRLGLSDVNSALLHEYLLHRRTPRHRLGTVKNVLDRLRSFFRYAAAERLITGDPTQGVSCEWLDVPGGLPAYQGVLRRILHNPRDMLRFLLPLFGPRWDAYLEHLVERGYSKSSLYDVLAHNFHFHRFLLRRRGRRLSRVSPRALEDFLAHKQRAFRRQHGYPMPERYQRVVRSRVGRFLAHAFPPRPRPAPRDDGSVLPDGLVGAYIDFCRDHGGLRPATRSTYRRELLNFRSFLRRRRLRDLHELGAAELDAFLMRRSKSMSARSLRSVVTALRSFLRYLLLHGHIRRDLAASVVRPSRFRDDLRPKYLPWRKIEELLVGIDRGTPSGKRDYAIVALLACHGLRAREAAALRIEDVDLDNRCLRLRQRKNGATTDLPISERAAEALRDYLAMRRDAGHPEVFLTADAPFRPLRGSALSEVAARHLRKRFHGRGGAYVLRHSFAKAMLDRGARLPDIGAMLGHRSLRSTLIYTRIATEDMREVALNYSEWL